MLEENAKNKICPFVSDFQKVGDVMANKPSSCVGSYCMAWKSAKETFAYNCKCGHFGEKEPETTNNQCGKCNEEIPLGWIRKYGFCQRLNSER